jgi:hypothetical protein
MDCVELLYSNAKKKEGRGVSRTWHNRYDWTTSHLQKKFINEDCTGDQNGFELRPHNAYSFSICAWRREV